MTTTNTAPATKAPAKAKAEKPAAKAPVTKAPAKAAAKPATTGMSSKIKWTLDAEKDEKGRVPQTGVAADGTTYKIAGAGGEWTATVTAPGGKVTVLGEKISHGKAYGLCVRHQAAAAA